MIEGHWNRFVTVNQCPFLISKLETACPNKEGGARCKRMVDENVEPSEVERPIEVLPEVLREMEEEIKALGSRYAA